jgi:hypothetical protein
LLLNHGELTDRQPGVARTLTDWLDATRPPHEFHDPMKNRAR